MSTLKILKIETRTDINKMSKVAAKTTKCEKSLMANYKKAMSEFHPYLDFVMDDTNCKKWWCRFRDIYGRDGEFKDGEYLIEMIADDDYPFTPPKFFVRTENGVYAASRRQDLDVCLGNGHLHKDQFAAGQGGMMGFIMMTLNGFMNWRLTGQGYNLLNNDYFINGDSNTTYQQSLDQKKNAAMRGFAKVSRDHNRKYYPEVMRQFDELPFVQLRKHFDKLQLPAHIASDVSRVIFGA